LPALQNVMSQKLRSLLPNVVFAFQLLCLFGHLFEMQPIPLVIRPQASP